MKQIYEAPELKVNVLDTQDVVCISVASEQEGELKSIDWNDLT